MECKYCPLLNKVAFFVFLADSLGDPPLVRIGASSSDSGSGGGGGVGRGSGSITSSCSRRVVGRCCGAPSAAPGCVGVGVVVGHGCSRKEDRGRTRVETVAAGWWDV